MKLAQVRFCLVIRGNLLSYILLIRRYIGTVALSYGEYLHGMRKFHNAKELYQKVIQQLSEKDFNDQHDIEACNMANDEVSLAATCALGQLEAHLGYT